MKLATIDEATELPETLGAGSSLVTATFQRGQKIPLTHAAVLQFQTPGRASMYNLTFEEVGRILAAHDTPLWMEASRDLQATYAFQDYKIPDNGPIVAVPQHIFISAGAEPAKIVLTGERADPTYKALRQSTAKTTICCPQIVRIDDRLYRNVDRVQAEFSGTLHIIPITAVPEHLKPVRIETPYTARNL
ncbi:hypothetical protein HYY74_03415 [Candidatus Woesearchaeota archaeon]|nr:hypothetical protein [Candidatus Woesearchaeota archaeon]